MNASDASIPEAQKKVSTQDDIYSRYVELSDGKGVHIQAWGIGEVKENFDVLKQMLGDFFNEGFDTEDEQAFKLFVDKQFNRIVKLVDSSISDQGVSLESIKGMNNILRVVDAFIDVNGLFEALGKVMEIAQKAMAVTNPQNN